MRHYHHAALRSLRAALRHQLAFDAPAAQAAWKRVTADHRFCRGWCGQRAILPTGGFCDSCERAMADATAK